MKNTKTKLISSVAVLLICFSMLIGSTFAWFTDSASTGVNKIQAGNLDVVLEMKDSNGNWVNAEGKTLEFKKADGAPANEPILWEPGCTYKLPELRIVNKGNLSLKYKIEVTGVTSVNGVATNNKLLEVINFTYGDGIDINNEVILAPGAKTEGIVLKGHMKEEAGNEYKGLSIDGISITVYAKQSTGEYDSFNNTYDDEAGYVKRTATIMTEANGETITLEAGKTYTVGNATVNVDPNGNITYTNANQNSQEVSITTDGGNLTVDAPNDTVKHYGSSDLVNITAIAGNSFHEFGKVGVLSIEKGRVVAENGDNISIIQVKNSDVNNPTVIAVPENKVLKTTLEAESNVQVTLNVIDSKGNTVVSKTIKTEDGRVDESVTIPEELKEVLSKDEQTIVEAKDYVAYDGNAYYDSLNKALNDAGENATVKLLKNITVSKLHSADEGGVSDSALVIARKGLTLDGGNNSVKFEDVENGKYLLSVNNSTEFITIKNITLEGSDRSSANINITGCSNVLLENVKSTGGGCSAIVNNSNVTIDGTNTKLETGTWHYSIDISNGGTYNPQTPDLTVKAGTIGVLYFEKNGSGTITGGNIEAVYTNPENFAGSVKITGGTFSNDPTNFLTEGLSSKATADNKFEIVPAAEGGYKIDGALPVGPSINGNVWTVNPENAQYTLDGAYGSIDGKTINLSTGIYTEKLVLGRPTKYSGSNTEYRHGNHNNQAMNYDDFVAYKSQSGYTEYCYYSREIKDVTFTSDDDAVLSGFVADAGAHVYGTGTNPIYDYVRDSGIKCFDTNNGYFTKCNLSNFTFDGLTFVGNTNIATSAVETVIDGFTFKNCSFTTESSTVNNDKNRAIRYYNENNNGNVKNLTVDNCTFNNCYQGIYTQKINGVAVKNSSFDTTGHNAIAVQSGGAVNHKTVIITGNTFANIGDRIIRFGDVGADTQITIQNNTATNSGDSSGEVIKAQSLAEGITYNISGNNWGDGKIVANDQLKDNK